MVGYHEQPGGLWSGDYTIVEFAALRTNPDLPPSSCSLHRTSEIVGYDPKVLYFPLAKHRNASERMVVGREKSLADDVPPSSASAPGQVGPPPLLEPNWHSATEADDNCDSDEAQRGKGGKVGKRSVLWRA